jgi:hypothetical protein
VSVAGPGIVEPKASRCPLGQDEPHHTGRTAARGALEVFRAMDMETSNLSPGNGMRQQGECTNLSE